MVSDGDGDDTVEVRGEYGDCGREDEDCGLSPVDEISLSGGDVMTGASALAISKALGHSLLRAEDPSKKPCDMIQSVEPGLSNPDARTESTPEDAEENKPRGTLRLCAGPNDGSDVLSAEPSSPLICSLDRTLTVDSVAVFILAGALGASDASSGGEVMVEAKAVAEGVNETDFTESKLLSTRVVRAETFGEGGTDKGPSSIPIAIDLVGFFRDSMEI